MIDIKTGKEMTRRDFLSGGLAAASTLALSGSANASVRRGLGARLAANFGGKKGGDVPIIPGGVAVEYCEKDADQSLYLGDMFSAAHNSGGVKIEIDMAPTRYIGSGPGNDQLIMYTSDPMWAYDSAGWRPYYWGGPIGTPPALNVRAKFWADESNYGYNDDIIRSYDAMSGGGMYMFMNHNGTRDSYCKVYGIKIYGGGVLMNNLVPCSVDGVGKFYDTISGVFKTSTWASGLDPWVAGPELR